MLNRKYILSCSLLLCCFLQTMQAQTNIRKVQFDFFGNTINLAIEIPLNSQPYIGTTEQSVNTCYNAIKATNYLPLIQSLIEYRKQYKLDDWLYYQLIRNTVQQISPKLENYERYTVFKWFLLIQSGYATTLKIGNGLLLFYVQTDEQIFNLPFYIRYGKQYVCLNYHDFEPVNFDINKFTEVDIINPQAGKAFTYKVTQLPDFNAVDYVEKDIQFNYYQDKYHFKVKLNPHIKRIFANYPVVDYASYFNIPLSKGTYQSLIPLLKKEIKGMNIKNGVDFLMRFTRYSFLFESDTKIYGEEKRLSPEQTLLFDQSDCEDRAGLFFFLVKEIYNLPMIVLSFPTHVTIAVKFDKPIGKPILYNGIAYSVCEPTPQKEDLNMGILLPELLKASYEVVYSYMPFKK